MASKPTQPEPKAVEPIDETLSQFPPLPEIEADPDYRPGMILTLLPRIMREVGGIGKEKVQQGFKYRGIDDVYNALHPLFHKHGVSILPQVLDMQPERGESVGGGRAIFRCYMRVRYRFYAPDGSYVTCITSGEAMDVADKASNKAMSAALKYALLQTFLIPTEDQPDADASSPEMASEEATEKRRQEAAALAIEPFKAKLAELKPKLSEESMAMLRQQMAKAGKDVGAWATILLDAIELSKHPNQAEEGGDKA